MRIRRLLACLVVVGGAVAITPSAASASESPGELFHCLAQAAVDTGAVETDNPDEITLEELERAAEGPAGADLDTEAQECYEAPSLVLPATGEIIWGGLAFLVVLFVLLKFAFPALKKGLKSREDKIREDLEAAERARSEAEAEAAQYRAQLGDARGEAGRIIEEARQAADEVRKDLIARAEADAAEVRQRAQEDARLASERALADLQRRVSELSIELAERIVQRNLDRDTQLALIESYINEVGSSRS